MKKSIAISFLITGVAGLGLTFFLFQKKKQDLSPIKFRTLASVQTVREDHIDTYIDPQLKLKMRSIARRNVVHLNRECTAFFINSNTLITNNHCVNTSNFVLDLACNIESKGFAKGKGKIKDRCKLIKTSEEYDLTILQSENHHNVQKLNFAHHLHKSNEYLYNISYPDGRYSVHKLKLRDKTQLLNALKKAGVLDPSLIPKLHAVHENNIVLEQNSSDKILVIPGASGSFFINDDLEIVGVTYKAASLKTLTQDELSSYPNTKFGASKLLEFAGKNSIVGDNLEGWKRRLREGGISNYRHFVFAVPIDKLYTVKTPQEIFNFIKDNNVSGVRTFIQDGGDVNLQTRNGETLLYLSMQRNFLEITKLLLKAGADPNKKNHYGVPPLLTAIQHNSPQMVKLLLEAGADPNERNRVNTLLMTAINKVPASPQMVKFLLEAGADPNARNDRNHTPLIMAVNRPSISPQMVKLLLEAGADPNMSLKERSPLAILTETFSVSTQQLQKAKFLLEAGADPNAPLWSVKTPAMAELLLEAGAQINHINSQGQTPLDRLYYFGEISEYLRSKGAKKGNEL